MTPHVAIALACGLDTGGTDMDSEENVYTIPLDLVAHQGNIIVLPALDECMAYPLNGANDSVNLVSLLDHAPLPSVETQVKVGHSPSVRATFR